MSGSPLYANGTNDKRPSLNYGSDGSNTLKDLDLEKGARQGNDTSNDASQRTTEDNKAKVVPARQSAQHSNDGHASSSERAGGSQGSTSSDGPQRPVIEMKSAMAKRQATFTPDTPGGLSVFRAPKVQDPDPAAGRLEDSEDALTANDFRFLMGMRSPSAEQQGIGEDEHPLKLATKHGLYKAICDELWYIQTKYRIFDTMTYVLLAVQIIISSIFTILGALRETNTYLAIAILGAVSTVIGGILALMKGQGLPNRLRQARDQMKSVRFEAEELYADFRSGRTVLYRDVKKIREDYLRVLSEMNKNHPETFVDDTRDRQILPQPIKPRK